MLRPASDVLDAHPLQRFFELGLASPHRVLPAVVGQHLGRLPVRRDAALERFHHERRLLMMGERVSDDEPAVVVHEHAGVEPLGTPQPEREDVRLPQLIRRRTFEAAHRVFARPLRRRGFDEPSVVQDPPHLLLRNAHRLEPREHVADPPRPPILVLLFERDDALLLHAVRLLPFRVGTSALRFQRRRSAVSERLHPLCDCRGRDPERLGHIGLAGPAQSLLHRGQLVGRWQLRSWSSNLLLFRHLCLPIC